MARRSTPTASALATSFAGNERFVVLQGKAPFLQGELTGRLRLALEQHSGAEVETVRCDGARCSLSDVLDELRAFGLMQQHKLVVVVDAGPFVKTHREALARYAEKPVDTATLLLRVDVWYKGNLDKLIDKAPGRIIKCDEPSRAEVEAWLTTRATRQHKVAIARPALALLIDHLGLDLGRLDAELGKLAVSVEPGGTIAPDQVAALVGFASDDEAWEIQEALLSGQPRRALEKLHELVELAGKDAIPIGWFVSDLMRKLHHAAALTGEGANEYTICSTLKVWPRERQQAFMLAARRLGTAGAARMLAAAVELDRRAKSGYGEALHNLERFCIQFTAALR